MSPSPQVPATLAGTSWRAISVDGTATVEDNQPSLTFAATDVNGNSGCNQFFGTYTYADGTIDITAGGMTMMACEEPVMGLESAYIAALDGASSVSVDDGGQLLLSGSAGDVLFVPAGA